MRKVYEKPIMLEQKIHIESHLLVGTNIGEGGAGQQGDVKGFVSFDEPEGESILEENPFE
jgi:hypothetical protein